MADSFSVRDQRKPGHHWADNEVIDDFGKIIGVYGYSIYMFLCRYAGNRDGRCCKTQGEIAEAFSISRDTVFRSVLKLQECQLIRLEKQVDNTVTYFILEVPKHEPLTAQGGNPLPLTAARVPPTAVTLPLTAASNKEERLSLDFNKTKEREPANADLSIQAIAAAHPKNLKPMATERALCGQIERLTRKMPMDQALAYLMTRTQLFAAAMKLWPDAEKKFIPEAHNWFTQGSFEADESLWVFHGKENGNGKQTILEKNLEALRVSIEKDGQ